MTNKLFPISLMTFLAIYLFVFPHYIKLSEEIKVKQSRITNVVIKTIHRQENNNAGLWEEITRNLKAESNAYINDWHDVVIEVVAEAIKSLKQKKTIIQVETVLNTTNIIIQNLPFSNYFKDFMPSRNITIPDFSAKETILFSKYLMELELLKLQAHYLEEILKLSNKQLYEKPDKYLIRGVFDKSVYRIGDSVRLDLKFLSRVSFEDLGDCSLTINGSQLDVKDKYEDYWKVGKDVISLDTLNIVLEYTNSIKGVKYKSKYLLKQ